MDKGKVEVASISELKIARFTYQPGWTWEKSEKPLVNTDSCQPIHNGYIISGRLRATIIDGGREEEYSLGDTFYIPQVHDEYLEAKLLSVLTFLLSLTHKIKRG